MKLKLQRIMRIGVAGTLSACLILASAVIVWNLGAYRKHDSALTQFDRFSMAVRLMAATSAERGPANILMSLTTEPTGESLAKLTAAREAVDRLFDSLTGQFAEEMSHREALRQDAQAFRESLARGRAAVDAQAATQPGQRRPEAIAAAIRTMFDASDHTQMLRDGFGEVLIGLSPELAPLLMATVAASDLREQAGRLGSLTVIRLNARESPSAEAVSGFVATVSLTDSLYRQIEHYAAPFVADGEVDRVMKAVTFGYFTGARPFAETVFGSVAEGENVGIQAFNDRYVPGLRTTETLRETFLEVGRAKLIAARDRSLRFAGFSLAGALAGGLLVVGGLIVFDRGLFRPLLQARQRMAQILEGDLAAGATSAAPFGELDELDRDIEKLRQHQIALRQLEREREALSHELRRLATTDPLTGLMNRRAFEEAIARLFGQPAAIGAGLGVVMVDIDHFKAINDHHGHGVGDDALRAIGRFLARELPSDAQIARFGGEEFVVALPDIGRPELRVLAETLRARLAGAPVLLEPKLHVTASFGVHWVPSDGRLDWQEFHRVADDHLYRAKRTGRNRVACSA